MAHQGTYDILGIGAPLMDHILPITEEYLKTIPGKKWGMETVSYEEMLKIIENSGSVPTQIAGGSAANAIKGLAQLGRKCALAGMIGKDLIGGKLQDEFQNYGIVPLFRFGAQPTGHVVCLVTPDGKRTCRSYLGASAEMSPKVLVQADFNAVKLVHIEGYTLLKPGLTLRAMKMAKKAGAIVSFDLASLEVVHNNKNEILTLLRNYVDVVFANEQEALALTSESPEASCTFLKGLCQAAVIMVGDKGSWVGNKQEQFRYPANDVEVIDTTGAGDLYASGFMHRYLNKSDLKACAELGTKLASEVIQVVGAEIPAERWQLINGK